MFNVEFEEVTNQFCAEFDTVVHTGEATLGEKTITQNGVYNASSDDLDGYSKVTANVPNTYTASDEGKVVSSGALVAQTSDTVTTNDTYDTTLINSLTVNVSGGGGGYGGTFTPASREFTYTFYAPGCTYLCCGSITRPDMTTGKGFVYSFFCTAGRYDCARSTNSGTSAAGEAYSTTNPTVSYSNDTFTLTWTNADITKIPQPGTEYVWKAW